MQLGFVIDQSRCIGCHACTVACKSENHVPVGEFRTWVKYTERGEFPAVRRSFAVLRCNQCTAAPCVTICPVSALEKRADGIVDVDPKACIGCKACTMGCPYDALYIHPDLGTAQKCHFCAHRTEQGLAPACAVVCPTEAIIPGDFDDPDSVVSRLRAAGGLTARKREAGTGPNVLYKAADPATLDPLLTNLAGGYLWAMQRGGARVDAQRFEAELESARREAEARTVYDVDRQPLWGGKITAYLFLKSLSAGAFLVGAAFLAPFTREGAATRAAAIGVPALALVFLAVTSAALVADLKRPERFLYILLRPNWDSWLARGTFILAAYGLLLTGWLAAGLVGWLPSGPLAALTAAATSILAVLSAAYTGWLFAQAKGRVLWMQRGLWLHLVVQALVAGCALLLLAAPALSLGAGARASLAQLFFAALAGHAAFLALERHLAPRGREEEYRRAARLLSHGPERRLSRLGGVGLGIVLPVVLLGLGLLPLAIAPIAVPLAAVLALAGLAAYEAAFVRAGQAAPIS